MTTNPTVPQDGGEKLAPCPFCGGSARWSPTYIDADTPGTVMCADGCGGTVICHGSKVARIAAWNTRATPDLAAVRNAALEEAARVAEWAHMVPPDGGSPSEAEYEVARSAAAAIRALQQKGPNDG